MTSSRNSSLAAATDVTCQVSLMIDYKKHDAAKIAALPGPDHKQLVEAEQQTLFGGAAASSPLTAEYGSLTQFPAAEVPIIDASSGLPRAELLASSSSDGDSLANGLFPAKDASKYSSCRELALARMLDFVESLDAARYPRSQLWAFYLKGDMHRVILARSEEDLRVSKVQSIDDEADLDETLGAESIQDFFADPEPTCVQMIWDPIAEAWIRQYNYSFSLVEVNVVGPKQVKVAKHVIDKQAFLENLAAIAEASPPSVVPDFRIRLSFEMGQP